LLKKRKWAEDFLNKISAIYGSPVLFCLFFNSVSLGKWQKTAVNPAAEKRNEFHFDSVALP
jgi:hypothetical protein